MGLIEECVGVDGKILSEVIIPTMNVSRTCLDNTVHPEEVLNKSQIYVTTAGWKGTFPQIIKSQGLSMVTLIEKLGEPRILGCGNDVAANSEGLYKLTLCQAA